MTNALSNPDSVHSPAGAYSHSVVVPSGSQVVYLSGQIGMDRDGEVPAGFAEQADQAWQNVSEILAHHGLGIADVVKTTHYLTDAANLAAYAQVRARWLGDARPASTLVTVTALARPDLLVEVEVVAAGE